MSQAVPTELDNLSIMCLKVYNYSLVAIGAHSERLCEISIDRSKKRVRSVRCHFTLSAPFLRRRRVTYHLQSHLLCMQRGRRIETRAGTTTHVTKCTTGTRMYDRHAANRSSLFRYQNYKRGPQRPAPALTRTSVSKRA